MVEAVASFTPTHTSPPAAAETADGLAEYAVVPHAPLVYAATENSTVMPAGAAALSARPTFLALALLFFTRITLSYVYVASPCSPLELVPLLPKSTLSLPLVATVPMPAGLSV